MRGNAKSSKIGFKNLTRLIREIVLYASIYGTLNKVWTFLFQRRDSKIHKNLDCIHVYSRSHFYTTHCLILITMFLLCQSLCYKLDWTYPSFLLTQFVSYLTPPSQTHKQTNASRWKTCTSPSLLPDIRTKQETEGLWSHKQINVNYPFCILKRHGTSHATIHVTWRPKTIVIVISGATLTALVQQKHHRFVVKWD